MRLLRYSVLLIALVLWAAGLSTTVAHYLYETGVIVDDYRFGDLYRLSALPRFKQPQPVCPPANRASDTARTHLYIIGDSFTEPQRLGQSDFSVSHYQRVAWSFRQRAQLDTTKRNVLLLETVERHFREHFSQPVSELVVETDTSRTPTPRPTLGGRISKDFHWSGVEERLESALFSQDWALTIKEFKAMLTLNWFGRENAGVSLSRDGRYLFIRSDTDTSRTMNSSFSSLSNREVDLLVDSVNAVAARYQRLGFDEVYLSIIPNKASVLEPNRGRYNRLIERIQEHPHLKVKPVDIFTIYKNAPASPYLRGDTHWDCTGRALWLHEVQKTARL